MRKIDMKGKRFGRLVVIEEAFKRKGKIYWKCLCECGQTTFVTTSNLRSGQIKSCGCLQRELAIKTQLTHGQSKTKLYKIWESMKRRCVSPKVERYSSYGGRGISVCEEWQRFEPFFEWAIENGYQDGLSIDRIDVDGNYEPVNCRWVTLKEQSNNKTNSRYVELYGEKKTISEIAEQYKLPYEMVYQRITKLHWSPEEAIKQKQKISK